MNYKKELDRQISIWQEWLLVWYSSMELTAQLFAGRQSASGSWARCPDNLKRAVRDHYTPKDENDLKQSETLPGIQFGDWIEKIGL